MPSILKTDKYMLICTRKDFKFMEYENRIKTMLMDLGVNPSLNGFAYLVEAVKFTIDDKKNKTLRPIMKLYKDVAKVFDTTQQRAERSMRHAIENAFNANNEPINNVFYGLISQYTGKVTVSTFIAVIAEKIIMNEN